MSQDELSSKPTSGTGPTPEFRSPVKAETLALLFRQSTPGMFFALAVAGLVAMALWPAVSPGALQLWLALVVLSFLARVVLFVAYRHVRPAGRELLRWRTPYIATLLFAAAVWGLGLLWLMPADSILYQAVAYVFLLGMASAALTTYSAERGIALATCMVTLMPTALWFLFQADALRLAMGLGGLLFMLSAWRATEVLSEAMRQRIRLTRELDQARASAERAAQRDELTGLFNRRALIELGEESVARCQRLGQPVSALVLDLDHFKSINDRYGHAAGDRALVQMATVLRQCLRAADICGRLGGEEFAVVMPNTALDDALAVAERARVAIAGEPVNTDQGSQQITTSTGVASDLYDLDELLMLADQAMYQAKQQGRNRTVAAQPPCS